MEPADDAGMSEDEVDVEVRHWHPPSIRIPVPQQPPTQRNTHCPHNVREHFLDSPSPHSLPLCEFCVSSSLVHSSDRIYVHV